MGVRSWFLVLLLAGSARADLAVDERRGVVYVANFTANRIDVVSIAGRQLQNSLNVAPTPGALALSAAPTRRWNSVRRKLAVAARRALDRQPAFRATGV